MKKLTPYLAVLVLSIAFTSCSSSETEVMNESPENLLQSYTLKRDANGAYSIDFNTTNNTDVTTNVSIDNSNQIVLAETKQKTNTQHSNNFTIENDQLKIGFLETNNGKRTKIYVEDENITFAKGVTEFLNSYSITANNDGKYTLSFTVNDNVTTDFKYNEELEAYEIHLTNSSNTVEQTTFSRIINESENGILKVNFLNHKYKSRNSEMTTEKKPELIIVS